MKKLNKIVSMVIMAALILSAVNQMFIPTAYASDEYDTLRDKWKVLLTGGTAYDSSDPDIASKIGQIVSTAQEYWDTLDKSASRTYLWSEFNNGSSGFHVRDSYWRLRAMALAYQVKGSSLQGNTALAADITAGMEWLNAHWYSTATPEPGNWFEWKVAIPFYLLDATILMYENMPAASLSNYAAAVDKHRLPQGSADANGLWGTKILMLNNILKKNGSALTVVKTTIEDALKFRSSNGNGFFDDGSYVDHTGTNSPNTPGYPGNPYNGGYGRGFYKSVAEMLLVLAGTAWDIKPVEKQVIYEWTYTAFEPFLHKGGVMSFVEGREMSRPEAQEHLIGHNILESITWMSLVADATNKTRMEQLIKYHVDSDTYRNFYQDVSIYTIGKVKAMTATAASRGDLTLHKTFARMDRVVHSRPGYTFGLAMNGHVINYEQINAENLHGWHYGQGATYLYNHDIEAYDQEYHPTVNAYRLAGTTAQANKNSNFNPNQSKWAGGADLGEFGAAGMELKPDAESLQAKKSWFMFDNEIVALGSNISAAGGLVVETTVENRKLNAAGNNALTVNGTAKPTALGWSETMTGVNWAHLGGTASAGADIGYYFPTASTLKGTRAERSGKWFDINQNSGITGNPQQIYKRNYLTLWFDHGLNPTAGSYAYALLPNMSGTQVGSYASAPQFTILEQSADAHGVRETDLDITAVNFWKDAVKSVGIVTSNKKASVVVKENMDDLEIAIADPTQENVGTIEIELNKAAYGILENDSQITVTQLSPTIKMTVNVNGAYGKTFKAKFGYSSGTKLSPSANLALNKPVTAGSTVNSGVWNAAYAVDGQRISAGTSNGWTSNSSLSVNHSEWIQADLGAVYAINKVDLYPRSDSGNVGQGFPVDFTIQVSLDGASWTPVVTKTGYVKPGNHAQSFGFPISNARYVRVLGTNLRQNPSDGSLYRMQLAELEVRQDDEENALSKQE
ncbi:polysaccharide lyase family 8 super-sandwich domain-containing protein [Paenibacillus sedimenti]|uniref:Discoidin domain-containing protein n=1 Tax=Paenibacillus sedimenti TaxID=2770274 RepID=A0A926QIQ7_9BACL|nr:polysaccharide lyase family 8 super-sandwich domain-containing protein [Paenibacillus sedimenti]MBD0380906.1 discoidin domain-containing protein [Paenibacillus sedimenti]